jgi:hypothetical protein
MKQSSSEVQVSSAFPMAKFRSALRSMELFYALNAHQMSSLQRQATLGRLEQARRILRTAAVTGARPFDLALCLSSPNALGALSPQARAECQKLLSSISATNEKLSETARAMSGDLNSVISHAQSESMPIFS